MRQRFFPSTLAWSRAVEQGEAWQASRHRTLIAWLRGLAALQVAVRLLFASVQVTLPTKSPFACWLSCRWSWFFIASCSSAGVGVWAAPATGAARAAAAASAIVACLSFTRAR